MLKKLRRKIILFNVLTVGVVLLIVFTLLCVGSVRNARRELEAGMHMALREEEMGNRPAPGIGRSGMPGQKPGAMTACVVVRLDETGEILSVEEKNAALSPQELEMAARRAYQAEEDSGSLEGMRLLYVREKDPMGNIRIAFGDADGLIFSFVRVFGICAGLYVLCLAALLGVSFLLSGIAVRPVQRAWEQQKQFVADASHELKTPLTVILANHNILLAHPEETVENQRQWLESTEEEVSRMKRLIDDMLLLARSEAQKTEILRETLDFSDLLQGQILTFEPLAYEQGVAIASDVPSGVVLSGDRDLLKQLVQILLDNAVKYARKETGVAVTLRQQGNVSLQVKNWGEVIAPQDLPRIFDRFYRTDSTRTRGGYGLGLAIAKNIAELHGADISVRSSQEEGTVFQVDFTKTI